MIIAWFPLAAIFGTAAGCLIYAGLGLPSQYSNASFISGIAFATITAVLLPFVVLTALNCRFVVSGDKLTYSGPLGGQKIYFAENILSIRVVTRYGSKGAKSQFVRIEFANEKPVEIPLSYKNAELLLDHFKDKATFRV